MVKIVNYILVLFIISSNAYALEPGKWSFVQEDEYCYIGSLATETDLPENKIRGDNYILVYRIIGSDQNIVQIEAGYDYNIEKNILVKIDNTDFDFYTVEDSPDSAWTDDDKKVIYAMKKGLSLIITGESSRGTITNDSYSLNGFTAAFNDLVNECK
jgi:hypothetical protein|tara:strand:- start:10014 stop:10484 length:471 start_codon:yes stop_codon:yes gene_type:complete